MSFYLLISVWVLLCGDYLGSGCCYCGWEWEIQGWVQFEHIHDMLKDYFLVIIKDNIQYPIIRVSIK